MEKRIIEATILVDLELQANLETEPENFVEDFFDMVNVVLSPLEVEVDVKAVFKESDETRLITITDEKNSSIGVSFERTKFLTGITFWEGLDLDCEEENSEILQLFSRENRSDVIIALTQLKFCDDENLDLTAKEIDYCPFLEELQPLGRALLDSACDPDKSLAIVRVTDRKAPFTAAHEILHLLGVEHDDSTENIMDPHLNDDDILAWFYDEAWTSETIEKLTTNLEDSSKNCIKKTENLPASKPFVWNRWTHHLKMPKRSRFIKIDWISFGFGLTFVLTLIMGMFYKITFCMMETLERKIEISIKLANTLSCLHCLAKKMKAAGLNKFRLARILF